MYKSQVVDPESVFFQLGIMRNIEREMPKAKRNITPNWVMVMDYLLGHTIKGGATSSIEHCRFLGVDPYGDSFSDDTDSVHGVPV